jgi:hypothetical protein
MKDGAKVLDNAVPFLECDRLCAPALTLVIIAPASEEYERLWPGLLVFDRGEETDIDLGLPFVDPATDEGEAALENGLLRF